MFAGSQRPIRMSSLPMLVTCPMRAVLLDEGLLNDESGAAADTGSLLHSYVSTWHGNGKKGDAAERAVDATAAKTFPLADAARAKAWFAAYQADPRNRNAVMLAVEQPVSLVLPCAEHDPTGEPVHLSGVLDQIREDDDGSRVWDLKTGRSGGVAMLDNYAFQLAGYTLAAAVWLGVDDMRPPGIIRLQGYDVKGTDPSSSPHGIFFRSVLTWKRCKMLLDEVVNIVADIRAGRVDVRPGFHCANVCPAKGLQTCLSLAEKIS